MDVIDGGRLGFNEEEVVRLIDSVLGNYDEFVRTILGGLNKNMCHIAAQWYAPENKQVVSSMLDVFCEHMDKISNIYIQILTMIVEAAKKWSSEVGAGYNPKFSFELTKVQRGSLDKYVDFMKPKDASGFVGYKLETAIDHTTGRPYSDPETRWFYSGESTCCERLKSIISGNNSFLGESQMYELGVKVSEFETTLRSFIEIFGRMFSDAIAPYIEKYEQTARANASMFASSN